jgi:hypothetical protein
MTADRTTIKATFDELLVKLRSNLVADPPTAVRPFRHIVVGDFSMVEHARPFLAVALARAKAVGAADGDKLMEVSMNVQVVCDILGSDAHGELLDRTAAVDDYLDSLLDSGVIDGADGFDDRVWTFTHPRTSSGARTATASAVQTCVVRVEREQNRVPGS